MTIIKMIMGILIFLAGFYWYFIEIIPGISNIDALITVFLGIFGIVLIITGFLIVFLLYEDRKWQKKEKEHNIKEIQNEKEE